MYSEIQFGSFSCSAQKNLYVNHSLTYNPIHSYMMIIKYTGTTNMQCVVFYRVDLLLCITCLDVLVLLMGL